MRYSHQFMWVLKFSVGQKLSNEIKKIPYLFNATNPMHRIMDELPNHARVDHLSIDFAGFSRILLFLRGLEILAQKFG